VTTNWPAASKPWSHWPASKDACELTFQTNPKGQSATGMSIREIAQAAGAGEATIYRIKKEIGL
ncbi:hypothetical protein, partial [Pseudomonas syringae]|uniref:hypothetical protein n=1 Tax=Pseudomonas syringae TaxID=317 RepID=UPI00117A8CFC